MDVLKKLFTDKKFVGALAVIVAAIAAVFGIDWTETGVQNWIVEAVGLIAALSGVLYAGNRVAKTGTDDTTE